MDKVHPLSEPPRRRTSLAQRGFTAIELMVVVSIVAILAALAAPSFTPLIERWRVRQAVNALESTLQFARSEAIKRGGGVVITKLANGTNGCTTAPTNNEWGCGWIVCLDASGNNACDTSETVLQRVDSAPRMEVMRTSGGANISLNRWGLVDGTWVGFSVKPQDKSISDPSAKGLCMSSGGRIRVISDPPCISG
jgi:type IV fimbrial biogenesis protein FimT